MTSTSIYKTMSHAKDCPQRPVRRVDGLNGNFCDSREDPTSGLVSTTNTIYDYEPSGSDFKIKGDILLDAWISY